MEKKSKDTLYQVPAVDEDFVFSDRVVEVFDDMLDRSIPFYHDVIKASGDLLQSFLTENDTVVDLGCATGRTLLEFSRIISHSSIQFIGVDNSPAMLDKGRLKAEMYLKEKKISFLSEDITNVSMQNVGAFILNYTLQFIRPVLRERFIKRLFESLRPGGILLLSEKTINHDPLLNRKYIDIYHQFKREKGYSELEIAKKREALENILIPFSIEENRNMLGKAGFQSVETYFQWFNFSSIVAIKKHN